MKKVISAVVAITVLLSMMITTNISTGITASAAAADSITIDAAKLASLSTAVGSAKVTTGASQGASNALIVSNPSGNFSPENYVKIDLSSYKNDMSHMRDIKIKMTSNAKDRGGDKAHFGVIYKSNVAWDIPYTGGLVPLGADGYVDVSVCRGFDSLKNSSWSSNGAYETRYYVTVSSLSSVSAILICPAYGGNTVSIESIKLVDVDDITTATLPAAGKIFCDWTGAVNHCKGEQAGTIKKGTPKNLKMPASYTASNGYMSIDTTGYTFNGNYVQIEVQMDKTKVQQAIDAANAGDGYLYGKIRFLGAKDGAGADIVKTTFKVYVFDSVAGWQAGMPELVAINEYKTTERSEVAYKCHVDNLEGMIPDTIAINYSNGYYEDGISFLQVQYSPIFSASADTSATFPVETPTMDKVTGTRPTTAAPTTQPTQATQPTTQPTVKPSDVTTATQAPTATTTNASIVTTTINNVLLGDCNGDGTVNGKDVLLLRKYIIKLEDSIDTVAADVNKDNAINGKDVLMLRKAIIGLIKL